MDTSDSFISSSTTEIVNPSDGIQLNLTVATRSRGRKPKIPTEQGMSTTDQIQEIATQDTTTQKTTTTAIEQLPPVAAVTSTSSKQIPRPKRGRKPKNSSPEQQVGTESETLQIRETATQETTTMVIEQLPPDAAIASTSSIQQIPRQKRGRKPKNSSPEQPVGTESETLQIRETATQDKETTIQETTTAVIEQLTSDAAMTSTSFTQQITRPKRGRKPKNSSPEQQVGTESETLQIRETTTQDKETTTQETTTAVIEQLTSDVAMTSTQQITRPKRGRKPKNSSPEQQVGTESETLQIRETATQDKETTTQETTTAVIERLIPDTVMTSTSSTQQITRPKRGRKPKNSSPEQSVGTESETLQIRETATQDKETSTQETTTAAIEQLLPDTVMTSTSSTQQITRPKRGRKPKNSSPEQSVGTESETLQIRETATQDKETTTQETTTAAIEQLLPDTVMTSTSSTQQITRPKRGRKPKNSSLEQPVGTESEILEQVTSINEQPAGVEEQLQSSSLPVVSIPKRERKLNETTAQITEEPTNVASTSASTTSQRGRKRKTVSESSTTADQMASNNPKTNEEISEGNPPKRGRINVSEQELAEPVEVPSTTTEATKNRGKKRKTTTENDNGEREADPAKENKKSKKSKKPEEKRLARTRTICSTPIYERIIRAEQQRIYMVNREKIDDFHEEFAVLGSTGNIYTVTITHVPNCTCPDFGKGNLCKHIFFVYLKVFRLNRNSSFIYQKALLSKELRSIFANAAPDPTVLANQRVRDKYKTFTSGELVSDTNENENEKRRPIEGNCPICYEPLEEKDHKNIVWCKEGCGNNLHKDCFEQWKRSKRGDKVTCVYCRINWEESGSELLINEEGYVNLGDVQGMNTIRDTTSYYRKYRSWY